MSEHQHDENQPESIQEDAGESTPVTEKPKLTPLEAIKARQAVMRFGKDGQGQRSGGNSDTSATSGPAKKPAIQQRKMG